jgi:hypothetical protein
LEWSAIILWPELQLERLKIHKMIASDSVSALVVTSELVDIRFH